MAAEFTFLMCSERSGSNLIVRMFDAHPRCCGPTPAHLVRLLVENRGRYGDLASDENWHGLLADTAALLDTKLGRWHTNWTAAELDRASGQRDLGALLRAVFRAEARAAGKEQLFLKENHLHRYLPFVLTAFEGPRLVALVRDPRDMALSWKNSSILRGDVVRAAGVWQEDQTRLAAVLAQLGPRPGVHLMTYEALVDDPEAELTRACAHLELEMSPAMLAHHRAPGAAGAAAGSEDWRNVARPVMRANHGKWRAGLSGTEAAYVENVCGETMAVFGYRPETADPRSREELEAELLPRERRDKPGWHDVDPDEKRARLARAAVEKRMAVRPFQPLVAKEGSHV